MENPAQFQRHELCAFRSYKNRELKVKKKKLAKEKRVRFYFVRSKFLGLCTHIEKHDFHRV